MIGQTISGRILRSRSGFSSGKILPGSPRVYSKSTAKKINISTKGIGLGLTAWGVFSTEADYRSGEITAQRRNYNHMNNAVGVVAAPMAIPIAVGDYMGQKYADEIVRDVTEPGGILYEFTKFLLELTGEKIEE